MQQCHGFEEGSILSVCAGGVKQQAPLEQGKPLKFPNGNHTTCDVSVDILAVVGRGKVQLNPGTTKYGLEIASTLADRKISCELEVRWSKDRLATPVKPTTVKAAKTSRPGRPAHRHKNAISVQEYMDQHRLLEAMHIALQSAVREWPDDPILYMSQKLKKISDSLKTGQQDVSSSKQGSEAKTNKTAVEPSTDAQWLQQPDHEPSPQPSPCRNSGDEAPTDSFVDLGGPRHSASTVEGLEDLATAATGQPSQALPFDAADGDTTLQHAVTAVLKVENVDYQALCANSVLRCAFETSVKQTIASEASVSQDRVHLQLSAGSVIVQARVALPTVKTAAQFKAALSNSKSFSSNIVAGVKKVPGIDKVATGQIILSSIKVWQEPAEPKPRAASSATTVDQCLLLDGENADLAARDVAQESWQQHPGCQLATLTQGKTPYRQKAESVATTADQGLLDENDFENDFGRGFAEKKAFEDMSREGKQLFWRNEAGLDLDSSVRAEVISSLCRKAENGELESLAAICFRSERLQ